MRLSPTSIVCASLIGALFIAHPIRTSHAQTPPLSDNATETWQMSADVVPLKHPGRVQAQAPKGSIEVVEFFSYTCPHCATFSPRLRAWHAQQPDSMRLIYLPISWRTEMQASQRLYFTLQHLKRLDLHEQVFADYAANPQQFLSHSAVLQWALRKGFDKKTWQTAYNSAVVTQNVRSAQQAFGRFELNAVPTLVVNGRYSLIPSAQVLDTLTQLVAHERTQ